MKRSVAEGDPYLCCGVVELGQARQKQQARAAQLASGMRRAGGHAKMQHHLAHSSPGLQLHQPTCLAPCTQSTASNDKHP